MKNQQKGKTGLFLGLCALSLAACSSVPKGIMVTSEEWSDGFANASSMTIRAKGDGNDYLIEFQNDNLSKITDTKSGSCQIWYYDESGAYGYENTYWRLSSTGERLEMLSMGSPDTQAVRSSVFSYQRYYEEASFEDGRYEFAAGDWYGKGTVVFGEDKSLLQINATDTVNGVEYDMVATFEAVDLNVPGF